MNSNDGEELSEARSAASSGLSHVKSIADVLTDVLDAFEDSSLSHALAHALPWAGKIGNALAEAAPPIKFVATLLSSALKQPDPAALAYVALTVAYQRSFEQSLAHVFPTLPSKVDKQMLKANRDTLAALRRGPQPVPVHELSIENALQQPFIQEADDYLRIFAKALGCDSEQSATLIADVHSRFPLNLKVLLADERTYKKFEPLTRVLLLPSTHGAAYRVLLDHANGARALFEEARVLSREPFSLASVYVETNCGVLLWGGSADGGGRDAENRFGEVDAFDPECGGNEPLLHTVLAYLKNESFGDAIVIQGVAGAGKSTFTLRLCAELVRQGLYPIRVRLRDIVFDRHAREAIPRALASADQVLPLETPQVDVFQQGNIFNRSVSFGPARICPYVIILDGWDEISISSNIGFRRRVAEFLEQVRSEYLENRRIQIRVILTGRPSADVTAENAGFFRAETPILTMRPFSPEQLREYLTKLHAVLEKPPMQWLRSDDQWSAPNPREIREVVDQYRKASGRAPYHGRGNGGLRSSSHFEVLGLPLLTLLTARLLGKTGVDVAKLVSSRTELFRTLLKQTIVSPGKAVDDHLDRFDSSGRERLSGKELRSLLHRTALAITIFGQERISFEELARCLAIVDNQPHPIKMQEREHAASDEFPILRLIISFFFRGGRHDLGAEFVHKAFREYLCAEAIVTSIQDFARTLRAAPSAREETWKDFPETDARGHLLQRLAPVLSAHWLRDEVLEHIDDLLRVAILESARSGTVHSTNHESISMEQWGWTRDALNDLWEHWALGNHLRPQPTATLDGIHYQRSYAEVLAGRLFGRTSASGDPRWPIRTTTIDAHLGDALFRLNAWIHARILYAVNWPGSTHCREQQSTRPYQSCWSDGDRQYICFRPSGAQEASYFRNYAARVNSAGWYGAVAFPCRVDATAVDFHNAEMMGMALEQTRLCDANLENVKLESASGHRADLSRANLRSATMRNMDLRNANLIEADLSDANLAFAVLENTTLNRANFRRCSLESMVVRNVAFTDVDLCGSEILHTVVYKCSFNGTTWINATLSFVAFQECTLDPVRLSEAKLDRVIGLSDDELA